MKKTSISRKGRKCKHPQCKHILSVYNHANYCFQHSGHVSQDERGLDLKRPVAA